MYPEIVISTPMAESTPEELRNQFRATMTRLAGAVVLVTCELEGRPWGLTVSSCCSISVDPPRLMVSLSRHTISSRAICEGGRFGISILSAENLDAARYGAQSGQPKFVDDFCGASLRATPRITGALGHVDCVVEQTIDIGDHVLIVGDVRQADVEGEGGEPLLYFDRGFRVVGAIAS